jgi:hypothetical protein
LSRHRTVPSGRSRAIALIAAGAFSVAGAASAAAATWPRDPARSQAGAAPATHAPAAADVAVADPPPPQPSPPAVSLAVRASQIRAAQAEHVAAQWQDARRAARRRAAAARAAAAREKAQADQSQAPAQPQPPGGTTAYAVAPGSAEQVAEAMLPSFGWSSSQFSCLYPLWEQESGWSVTAANPDGAYGIPQALPGGRMASAGPGWQTDAATQIRWGLEYIQGTYGSPCGAWDHEEATGWY